MSEHENERQDDAATEPSQPATEADQDNGDNANDDVQPDEVPDGQERRADSDDSGEPEQ